MQSTMGMAMACLLVSLGTSGGTQAGDTDTDSATDAVLQLQAERAALQDLVTDPVATRDNDAATTPATLGSADFAVRRSGIAGAGRGMFALRDFARGDTLSTYRCDVQGSQSEKDATRTWRLNATHSCDGSVYPLHNPTLYANSIATLETCSKQNAATKVLPGATGIVYVATRDVEAGDEIFIDYGRLYFKLASSALPSMPYECHTTPLHVAASRGDLHAVMRLVGEGTVRRRCPAYSPLQTTFSVL